ncbi:thymopoietin a [Kryptolebias marmoratus]|uniref:Thymopoietin a n=1 Tax=Kryptolebias marmoratus TaxID=37003 RepID=A0A3Q3AUW3_KRYMA|nr:thymopoietin a [Kryptolebias marmoratus]
MPEYLEDPAVLTKDKLRAELLAHNVELPSGNPNKDAFVQLYLKNLTVRNKKHHPNLAVDGFSSDEELPPPVVPGRSRSSGKKSSRKSEELDMAALTDEGLRDELLKHGVDVGPIVASTRKLYEKKLQKLLVDGSAQLLQVNHNGNSESDAYSDKEDDMKSEPEPKTEAEPEPAPVVERAVRSRGKNSQQQTVGKSSDRDPSPKLEWEEDILKELVPNEANSPTGFSATCRRSIRGAAGRPVASGDLETDEDYLLSSQPTKTISSSHTESHRVHRVSSLPPCSSSSLPPLGSCLPSSLSCPTPPAGQKGAVRGSLSLWVKLALLSIVAVFLFLVYQNMEPNFTSM